jgi:hypothetical protein
MTSLEIADSADFGVRTNVSVQTSTRMPGKLLWDSSEAIPGGRLRALGKFGDLIGDEMVFRAI